MEDFLQAVHHPGLLPAFAGLLRAAWDADAKERRRGKQCWAAEALSSLFPEGMGLFPFLVESLSSGDGHVRRIATQFLVQVAPSAEEAARLLAARLDDRSREIRSWAAIHLARLAPGTPGLVTRLLEGLGEEWSASAEYDYDHGDSGTVGSIQWQVSSPSGSHIVLRDTQGLRPIRLSKEH